ncbi:hypothetical protein BDZ85DRAFT_321449 [Elsinoe ampelina]|uniref:BRCT domain-containing protein n=1 Tax=Elsinoe ampelina TaxID=302913 RepID=A0A6A6G569_9PEZI|nr:hypothetical protein BDZ85DRAFT_321449 [Elsinoe ampelina]
MASAVDDSLESQHFRNLEKVLLDNSNGHKHPISDYQHTSPRRKLPRPTIAPHDPRPPPIATRSAPNMGGMMTESSPQHHAGLTRAVTFHVLDAEDGDTQPMPSQVYRDYQKSFHRPGTSQGNGPGASMNEDDDEDMEEQVTQIDATPGKPGMVDFGGAWSQTQGNSIPPVDVHSVHESIEDDASPGMPSSLQRDTHLKTPGLAGHKRNRKGETITPTTASKTPGSALSNIFGNRTAQPLMTATQMFDNTQAMTSPAGDLARSDPVESRPSPNFLLANTVSPSIHALSSPTKASNSRFTNGPRETYKPMEESQERRDAKSRLHRDSTHPPSSSKVIFDDDTQSTSPGNVPTSMRSTRFRDSMQTPARRAKSEFARSHADLVPRTRMMAAPGSRNAKPDRRQPVIIADDDEESEEDEDSVYDYDEFGGDIVQSQRKSQSQDQVEDDDEVLVSDREEDMEVAGSPEPEASKTAARLPTKDQVDHLPRVDSSQDASSTNPAYAVVANSQPGNINSSINGPPRIIDPSSIASYVPGSQLPIASSQWRPILEGPVEDSKMSSLPRPPESSGPQDPVEETSGNMPSSPPIPVPLDDPDDVPTGEDEVLEVVDKQPEALDDGDNMPAEVEAGKDEKELVEPNATKSVSKQATGKSDSNKTSIFDTAATHISASQPRSSAQSSQRRRLVSESPRKVGNVRRMADIANDPSPPDSLGEVDISIGMDLMNEDDQHFLQMTKSPVKRVNQKVYGKKNALRKSTKAPVAPSTMEVEETIMEVESAPVAESAGRDPAALSTAQETAAAPQIEHSSPVMPAPKRRKTRKTMTRDPAAGEDAGKAADSTESLHTAEESARSVDEPEVPAVQAQKQIETTLPDAPLDEPAYVDGAAAAVAAVDDPADGAARSTSDTGRNRVLAFFKGSYNAFYPATFLAVVGSGDKAMYQVRFDEGTEATLERHQVAAFDLRLDDAIKLDIDGKRQHTYVICGFEAPTEQTQQELLLVDVNGHAYVQLKIKSTTSGRKSLPTPATTMDEVLSVPTMSIKVTPTMWPKFNTRTFTPPATASNSRLSTPGPAISTPATPSSRSRRLTMNSGHIPIGLPTPISHPVTSSVFSNMAFAISYTSSSASDAARDHTITQLTSSGGLILHSGLHELFDITLTTSSDPLSEPALRLKPRYAHLKFVALIADTHSRTQKYIQSLSLSIPTLHHRWISDSLLAGHPLDWGRYLLPAGESSFLGTVRSRTLVPYPPATASLAQQLQRRDRLLNGGGGVLLLADDDKGKGKKKADRREVYAFLSLALGAERVRLVDSIEEARACLDVSPGPDGREAGCGQWKWKWLHTCPERVESVAASMAGQKGRLEEVRARGAAAGRKRKRGGGGGRGEEEGGEGRMSVLLEGGVRVVGDEFVIQSLILGALVEG